MNQNDLMRLGMALGMLYGVYKVAKDERVRAMALGVAGIVIAKRVPVLKDQL